MRRSLVWWQWGFLFWGAGIVLGLLHLLFLAGVCGLLVFVCFGVGVLRRLLGPR